MSKKTTRTNKPDIQEDHAASNIGLGTANEQDREEKSQLEGPAAYAPHNESEKSNRLSVVTGADADSMPKDDPNDR